MIERNGGAEEGVKHVGVVVELLVNHEAEDTHLSSTTVVELDGSLARLLLSIPSSLLHLPHANSFNVLLDGGEASLHESDEEEDLGESGGRNGVEHGKAGLHGGEGNTVSDISRESVSLGSHDVTHNSEHGNAAMLDLVGSQLIEGLLVCSLSKKIINVGVSHQHPSSIPRDRRSQVEAELRSHSRSPF